MLTTTTVAPSRFAASDAPSHFAPSDAPSHAASRLRTELVTDYDAFLRLEAEWNDAVARARVPHPFLRHEWIRTWWDAFGGSARLHILIVRDHAGITAIAPLMRETTRTYGMPATTLRFIQNDHTPRIDFIIADRSDESYEAIWKALRSAGGAGMCSSSASCRARRRPRRPSRGWRRPRT